MIKLIVSNAEPSSKRQSLIQQIAEPNSRTSFMSAIQTRGPGLYLMTADDASHYLNCELVLEVEEGREKYGQGTVICHFPKINDEELKDLINEDETLYSVIMIQFQMKLLEQLLLFCATHYASKLIIYPDDGEEEDLGIYLDFITPEDEELPSEATQTKITIPADSQTFDEWIEFMEMVSLKLRQTLWQDQRKNPTIKQYLKIHPFG